MFLIAQTDQLYFDDKKRRIDYVLAWPSSQSNAEGSAEAAKAREVFEMNLVKEGLDVQQSIKVSLSPFRSRHPLIRLSKTAKVN